MEKKYFVIRTIISPEGNQISLIYDSPKRKMCLNVVQQQRQTIINGAQVDGQNVKCTDVFDETGVVLEEFRIRWGKKNAYGMTFVVMDEEEINDLFAKISNEIGEKGKQGKRAGAKARKKLTKG